MIMKIRVLEADFSADRCCIEKIRICVFVAEQGVPESMEMDDRDSRCLHFLAFEADKAVGTARLDIGLLGKVGRVAVLPEFRRKGIGTQLMHAVHDLARARGLSAVWCHAQLSALDFYHTLGYQQEGLTFLEAGIPHVTMRSYLSADSRSS